MLTKRVKRYWTSNINKLIKRLLIDKIEPVYSILDRNDDFATNAGPADFVGAVDTTSPGMYQVFALIQKALVWFLLFDTVFSKKSKMVLKLFTSYNIHSFIWYL